MLPLFAAWNDRAGRSSKAPKTQQSAAGKAGRGAFLEDLDGDEDGQDDTTAAPAAAMARKKGGRPRQYRHVQDDD